MPKERAAVRNMMSINQRINFSVSVTWMSRLISVVLGLVLIPILFRHMKQEELGIWFMLGQSTAFLSLMDFGIAPTLTRRIALAKGKSGSDPSLPLNIESIKEIADLSETGRIIYQFLAIGVFLIAWTIGFFFISHIELYELNVKTVWIAWTVICLSHAVGVWSTLWGCLLQGTGYVGWDSVISIILQVITLLMQIGVVLLGGGLISLAVVATSGSLITRFVTLSFIRWKQPELFSLKGCWNIQQFKSMIEPALKAWLTGLGAFLILRTDQFFIAFFRGASDIPSYHAGYQLVSNLYMLAVAISQSSKVFISQLWQAGAITEIHKLVQRNMRFTLSLMACGSACLIMVGKELIELWLGDGHFIGYPILTVFCVMLFLEAQHVGIATSSRATEDEVFAPWALTAGVLNILFTWFLIKPFGLLGVALGTMFAQMLTNNWYVVYRGLWRLKMSRWKYLIQIFFPAILTFFMALTFCKIVLCLIPPTAHQVWFLIAGIMTTGLVLFGTIWISSVLESNQRKKIQGLIMEHKYIKPFFSVCIPTYNHAGLLPTAVESVLKQDFENFELIISDNNSTDDTLKILDSYHDSRIRILSNTITVGMYANHNRLIDKASGKWIIFLHSDDTLLDDSLSLTYKEICSLDETLEVDIILPHVQHFPKFYVSKVYKFPENILPFLRIGGVSPSGTVYRGNLFKRIGKFDENCISADCLFLLTYCLSGKSFFYSPSMKVLRGKSFESGTNAAFRSGEWHFANKIIYQSLFANINSKTEELFEFVRSDLQDWHDDQIASLLLRLKQGEVDWLFKKIEADIKQSNPKRLDRIKRHKIYYHIRAIDIVGKSVYWSLIRMYSRWRSKFWQIKQQ